MWYVYIFMCVYMCVEARGDAEWVFLTPYLTLWKSFTKPKLTDSASLANQQTPGIFVSTSPALGF